MQPVAVYALVVPGDGQWADPFEADEYSNSACVQVTMAAIDASTLENKNEPITLKMVRRMDLLEEKSDEESEDEDSDDEEQDDSDGNSESDDQDDNNDEDQDVEEELEKKDGQEGSEEEEDDDDDDVQEEEYVLCTLQSPNYQISLQLTIYPEEPVFFYACSKSQKIPIYLTGNYMLPKKFESDDDDDYEEYDSELEDEEALSDLLANDNTDSFEEAEGRIEELDTVDANKVKRKFEGDVQANQKLSKNQLKKLKKQKGNDGKAIESIKEDSSNILKPKSVTFDDENQPPEKKKTLESGVTISDSKIGNGTIIKQGSKVGIRYIGKIAKTKAQFDSSTKGKPFSFTVGRGEVINGLEKGLIGMKLGGERKIEIPANLAYGKKGSPPSIPPNSDLIFDVRVVQVK